MKKIKVAGVVVLYNPTTEDINNIHSYIDDIDILYVMDNSKENNKSRLPKNEKIEYIFNNENLGIATPLNKAAELARKKDYQWLLTMDQDTNFPKDILKKMIERINDIDCKNIGIITPWHNTKLKEKKPKEKIDYPLDVMTSGNLVNLDIHKKIGGFMEELFIDGVDMEYCLKLEKYGYRIMRFNDLEIKHNLGDICYRKFFKKDLLITNHSAMRRYYQCRNYHYIKDLYEKQQPQFCNTLVKVKATILGIIIYENNKIKKIQAYIKGYRDYKKGKKGRSYE
ncbi:MAG: glycosyltransferase [Bacilli bacterium]|nr:glycosyltransferase [Bacilli bacterium]